MINVDFTNIDNAKLIGRLLPFWARGRKISLFLQSILHPINTVHSAFKAWALQRYIDCQTTAQRLSLEWYLKYKLQSHFLNPDDSFLITSGIDRSVSCFSLTEWHNGLHWDNNMLWDNNNGGAYPDDFVESPYATHVYAPEIVDTINYNHQDYERHIRNIMSKYMINFNKIKIFILRD